MSKYEIKSKRQFAVNPQGPTTREEVQTLGQQKAFESSLTRLILKIDNRIVGLRFEGNPVHTAMLPGSESLAVLAEAINELLCVYHATKYSTAGEAGKALGFEPVALERYFHNITGIVPTRMDIHPFPGYDGQHPIAMVGSFTVGTPRASMVLLQKHMPGGIASKLITQGVPQGDSGFRAFNVYDGRSPMRFAWMLDGRNASASERLALDAPETHAIRALAYPAVITPPYEIVTRK